MPFEVASFEGHNPTLVVAVTRRMGRWVVSAAGDATIKVWSLAGWSGTVHVPGHSDRSGPYDDAGRPLGRVSVRRPYAPNLGPRTPATELEIDIRGAVLM